MRAKFLRDTAIICILASVITPTLAQRPAKTSRNQNWNIRKSKQSREISSPAVRQLRVPLSDPSGIGADDAGRIYVLDNPRQALTRFLPTGEVDKVWLQQNTTIYNYMSRFMFHVGYDNHPYLSPAAAIPNIVRLNEDGSSSIVANTPKDAYQRFPAPSKDGLCYIYQYGNPSSILAYSSDGTLKTKWEVPELASMACSPNGLIYAAVYGKPTIKVFDPDGKELYELDLKSTLSDARFFSQGIDVDSNGDIYISYNGRWVVRFDGTGKILSQWVLCATSDLKAGQSAIRNIAVRNGTVYIIASKSGGSLEIQTYTPEGRCISRYVPPAPEIELPSSVAVQPDGSYAYVRSAKRTLQVFDAAGKQVASVPNASKVIAIPYDGYVCADNEVTKFDTRGKKLVSFSGRDSSVSGHKETMHQIAYSPSAVKVFALNGWYQVITFNVDGSLAYESPKTRDLSMVTTPGTPAVDSKGCLYVPDVMNHRVVKYSSDGLWLDVTGKKGSGFGELQYPTCAIMDKKGILYVVDNGNSRIHCFTSDGKPLGTWGTYGSGYGQLKYPLSATFGPSNTIWICDTQNDRIVRVPLDEFWKELQVSANPKSSKAEHKPKR